MGVGDPQHVVSSYPGLQRIFVKQAARVNLGKVVADNNNHMMIVIGYQDPSKIPINRMNQAFRNPWWVVVPLVHSLS